MHPFVPEATLENAIAASTVLRRCTVSSEQAAACMDPGGDNRSKSVVDSTVLRRKPKKFTAQLPGVRKTLDPPQVVLAACHVSKSDTM